MPALLAVDLGLRTGLAGYRGDGRLDWYSSHHYADMDKLGQGLRGLLDARPEVGRLVVEGGGPIAKAWLSQARRRGIEARQIGAELWRSRFFNPSERFDAKRAKRSADGLARRVIAWSGAARPTSLRHDAAEAIAIGLWGVLEAGWLDRLPPELGG